MIENQKLESIWIVIPALILVELVRDSPLNISCSSPVEWNGGPVYEEPVPVEPPQIDPALLGREFFNNADSVVASLDINNVSELEKRIRLLNHAMAIIPESLAVQVSADTVRRLGELLLARVDGDFTKFLTQADTGDASIHYLVIEHFWFAVQQYILENGDNAVLGDIKEYAYLVAQLGPL